MSQIELDDEIVVKRVARYFATHGFKSEKKMMNNIPRLNFLKSREDPLHAYYKQKLAEYLRQIQETGDIVDDFGFDTNTSTTQITEPPPGAIRNDIESMASFISTKRGLVVERFMMQPSAKDGRYSFMWKSDPFHAFYKQKLTEYLSRNQPSHDDDDDTLAKKAAEYSSWIQQEGPDQFGSQLIVLPHMLQWRLPKGMDRKEFGIMKLTAQFGAWYGNDFWLDFKDRDGFEFTNPTDWRFPRFTRFVLEYSQVFKPPKDLQETVSNSDAYMAAIHDAFFRLLHQWEEKKWWDGGVTSMADWHASLEKDFANYQPPPPGPEPKRRKLQSWCTIRVSLVSVNGHELNIIEKTVQSLSETVASLKEKIAEEIHIPPEKQLLLGQGVLLQDNNRSLADYNVGAEEILTLSLCTCGRERDLDKACCCNEIAAKAIGEFMLSFNSSRDS